MALLDMVCQLMLTCEWSCNYWCVPVGDDDRQGQKRGKLVVVNFTTNPKMKPGSFRWWTGTLPLYFTSPMSLSWFSHKYQFKLLTTLYLCKNVISTIPGLTRYWTPVILLLTSCVSQVDVSI